MADATLDAAKLDALRELVGDDEEALRDIAGAFVEDVPALIDDIRRGLASQDDVLVRRAAHTLKSNSLTFGAVELGAACRELEEHAQAGGLADAERLAATVVAEWERARRPLEALSG